LDSEHLRRKSLAAGWILNIYDVKVYPQAGFRADMSGIKRKYKSIPIGKSIWTRGKCVIFAGDRIISRPAWA
jgi:hypothetical protein